MDTPTNRSLPELFGSLVDDVARLFRTEIQLAKAETSEKIAGYAAAVAKIAAGAAVLVAALVLLLQAAAVFLTAAGLAPQFSLLAVGVLAAIVGGLLLTSGQSQIRNTGLTPQRTVQQMQRDVATAKEQLR
ncbi:MAG: phage holin family protein [Burkholderiales bacterium]|nr:phage holin family protein [Burkholderiales bacterium]